MDIFSIIILFFVISAVVNLIKRFQQPAKKPQDQTMTQEQIEATQRKPAPKPTPKPADFRFPTIPISSAPKQPVYQEGRDPNTVVSSGLSKYQSIAPSADLDVAFSDYKGSLDATRSEGVGYKPEEYDDVSDAYQNNTRIEAKVLPEAFNRNSLLQAVVMSEILKRPGAARR